MPHHRDNFLLNLLEPDVLDRIEPQLSIIDLQGEQVLAETHQRIERVYFPHSGIISCVVELIGGGAIETGMIGKDGNFGSSQALDDKVSLICGYSRVVAGQLKNIRLSKMKGVVKRDRLKKSAKLVITVRPFAQNTQVPVDLGK